MFKKLITFLIVKVFVVSVAISETSTIKGKVVANETEEPVVSATIRLVGTNKGVFTNSDGSYELSQVPKGKQKLHISSIGYRDTTIAINVAESILLNLDITLMESNINIDEVVVTGTRTSKRKTDSPVIVNLINSSDLAKCAAVNLADGLQYQPGLRVETDCQTCNYTQLRMNGLQGGYSQILVNSRPIFSPLTGLYGLEQIPSNMIDRIEVVRGGISALYGSSAIGGTVNIITKMPESNSYSITNSLQSIRGASYDNIVSANGTVLQDNIGVSFYFSNRNRQAYDANGDNFSELPILKDNSFGANIIYLPTDNQRLSVSLSSIYEYRYGGEMVETPAHLALQSEERTHNVFMGNADYQIDFDNGNSSLAIYYGGQTTARNHYTGIMPDEGEELESFLEAPPYGTSDVVTHQGGIQYNNNLNRIGINSVLTIGAEYVYDDVYDEIESYNYIIDQTTTDLGMFVQNDWDIDPTLNFLAGFRLDKHNLVDNIIFSPRLSLLYKLYQTTQFRLGWGTGFRAPQAFDTDLHIAFAGGGVSRVSLSESLKEEKSNSYTASINYDKATEHYIAGFTIEGFYTKLEDAFYLFPLGEDNFGERFEKRNGEGASVMGVTLETRANFDYKIEIEAGITIQRSEFDEPIANIDGLELKKEFLRTPNNYGYATVSYTPSKELAISSNLSYTGSMLLAHFAGENTGQDIAEYFESPSFFDLSIKAGYTFDIVENYNGLELYAGVKNIFDSYQNNFDRNKNRDSNFIYGPSLPRTFLIGISLKSL